jgi:hypothetical protein
LLLLAFAVEEHRHNVKLFLQTTIIIVWRAWQSPYGDVGVDSINAMPEHA